MHWSYCCLALSHPYTPTLTFEWWLSYSIVHIEWRPSGCIYLLTVYMPVPSPENINNIWLLCRQYFLIILLFGNCYILIRISLKLVPKVPIKNGSDNCQWCHTWLIHTGIGITRFPWFYFKRVSPAYAMLWLCCCLIPLMRQAITWSNVNVNWTTWNKNGVKFKMFPYSEMRLQNVGYLLRPQCVNHNIDHYIGMIWERYDCFPLGLTFHYWLTGTCLTKTYDVTIKRYCKSHMKIKVSKMHILQCMDSKFLVKFQRCPLKFNTKFWVHTPQNVHFSWC